LWDFSLLGFILFPLRKTSKLIKKQFSLLVQLIRIKVGVSTFKVVRLNYENASSQTSPPQVGSCGILDLCC
jgi:hypothetical protein